VKLVGDKTNLPIALDSDLGFSLPQDARAANDGAYVSTNRQAKSFAWRVDIRSPGVPPNMRRLGDLRLECKIDLMAAELTPGIKPPAFYALLALGVDPCTVRTVSVGYFAERPLFGVSMVAGARRQELPAFALFGSKSPALFASVFDWILLRDRFYSLPIWDARWPDDSLVELEYVDHASSASAPGIEATIEAGAGEAMKNIAAMTLLCAIVAHLAGCATTAGSSTFKNMSQERAGQLLVVGKTTKEEVRAALGPADVTPFAGGARAGVRASAAPARMLQFQA